MNSDDLGLLSEKYEVCKGGNWCGIDSNLKLLLEDDLLEVFELYDYDLGWDFAFS